MTNWFTSDLHLGHQNIISYCDRPYTRVLDMDEDLVERWNYVVEPRDVVYVVGDFAMGRLDDSLAWTSLLNGTKFLIPGNHDRMFNTAGTKYANSCQRYLDAGFAEIREGIGVYDLPGGVNAIVNHFPRAGADPHDDMQYEDRFAEFRPPAHGHLVHGHTHGKWRKKDDMVDVGVDAWGGFPVSWEEVADLFLDPGDANPLPWKP
jgi:calcineurin-like phosphoesterase family protein